MGALVGCDEVSTPKDAAVADDGAAPIPPEPGVHVLTGEAMLETPEGTMVPRSERFELFVPEPGSDRPMYVRDARWGTIRTVTFADGSSISDDLCDDSGCDLRIDASTGCAELEYTEYFRPEGQCQDSGYALTGSVRACPTDEAFSPTMTISGEIEPQTILPDGRLRVRTNFPLADTDVLEVMIDGAPHTWTKSDESIDGFTMELGTLPMGSDVAITYSGTWSPVLSVAEPFRTSAVVTDLGFDSAPPDGSMDARGNVLQHDDGALHIDDAGHCPRDPFAIALALGDPGAATTLHVDFTHATDREAGETQAQLVRSDGTGGELTWIQSDLAVPPGTGPVWLILVNDELVPVPNDYADPEVLRIDALEWR